MVSYLRVLQRTWLHGQLPHRILGSRLTPHVAVPVVIDVLLLPWYGHAQLVQLRTFFIVRLLLGSCHGLVMLELR
jgi:hypothetical protein